jgi:RimJ/RimL family protein N-acetyltransferase
MSGSGVDVPVDPPVVSRWPTMQLLAGHDVVLARPRLEDAPATLAMQADERLWVDVPPAWRVRTLQAQQDDFRRFLAHWREHGFGYWLAWSGAVPTASPSASAPNGTAPPEPPVGPAGIGGLRWLWWRGRWVLNVYVRIAVASQGNGLATAMLTTAMDRLDGDLAEPTDVVVRTRDANAAMLAVARRLGMADLGHEQREMGQYRVFARHVGGSR